MRNTNFNSIAILETARTHYSAEDAAEFSLTVGDLIRELQQFDEETPVIFSNDGGYTYGRIDWGTVSEREVERDEETED